MNEENNITQEQVLEAIKKKQEENRVLTREFEQRVYQGLKEDFGKLEEMKKKTLKDFNK